MASKVFLNREGFRTVLGALAAKRSYEQQLGAEGTSRLRRLLLRDPVRGRSVGDLEQAAATAFRMAYPYIASGELVTGYEMKGVSFRTEFSVRGGEPTLLSRQEDGVGNTFHEEHFEYRDGVGFDYVYQHDDDPRRNEANRHKATVESMRGRYAKDDLLGTYYIDLDRFRRFDAREGLFDNLPKKGFGPALEKVDAFVRREKERIAGEQVIFRRIVKDNAVRDGKTFVRNVFRMAELERDMLEGPAYDPERSRTEWLALRQANGLAEEKEGFLSFFGAAGNDAVENANAMVMEKYNMRVKSGTSLLKEVAYYSALSGADGKQVLEFFMDRGRGSVDSIAFTLQTAEGAQKDEYLAAIAEGVRDAKRAYIETLREFARRKNLSSRQGEFALDGLAVPVPLDLVNREQESLAELRAVRSFAKEHGLSLWGSEKDVLEMGKAMAAHEHPFSVEAVAKEMNLSLNFAHMLRERYIGVLTERAVECIADERFRPDPAMIVSDDCRERFAARACYALEAALVHNRHDAMRTQSVVGGFLADLGVDHVPEPDKAGLRNVIFDRVYKMYGKGEDNALMRIVSLCTKYSEYFSKGEDNAQNALRVKIRQEFGQGVEKKKDVGVKKGVPHL